MQLTHEDHETVRVIRLDGELHAEHTERLTRLAQDGLANGRHDLVVDLAELDHVDSQGLETLLQMQDQCRETLGQLRLIQCPEYVQTVLKMTRLSARFHCDADENEAYQALSSI